MKNGRGGFLASEFDALERNEALSVLVHCLAQLPPMLRKVLALHYNEGLQIADIAACGGLTDFEIDQIHAKTLEVLETMLAPNLASLYSAKPTQNGRRRNLPGNAKTRRGRP